jgi:hypothetical protein
MINEIFSPWDNFFEKLTWKYFLQFLKIPIISVILSPWWRVRKLNMSSLDFDSLLQKC